MSGAENAAESDAAVRERPRVALDASALMAPVECDLRLFEELDRLLGEYERIVPEAVLVELDRLSTGTGREATAAAVGRDLAERCTVVRTGADNGDDALVALAAGEGNGGEAVAYVVTNDRSLRDRVPAPTRTIGLRGRNKLGLH
jgi:rRNA-processing protein FCF1